MKKQYIILITSVLMIFLGIYCFLSIPRISYKYDKINDCYYVNRVYGNAQKYTIKGYIKSKPVVKITDRAFYQKDNIQEIVFEEPSLLIEIGRLAFSGCTNLKKIDLSNVKIIGRNAFEECISLNNIVLGCEHILGSTFYDCISLEEVTLINTLSIGSYAFANTNIKTISLPDTMKDVYHHAFSDMSKLEEILIYSYDLINNEYLKQLKICKYMII